MIFDTNKIHNFAEFTGFQSQLLNQYSLVSKFKIVFKFILNSSHISKGYRSPPSGITTKKSTTEAFGGVSNEKSPILVTHFLGK